MKGEERENLFKNIVLRMSPLEIEGTVKTENKELEMDLESLIVYCPETLYKYLMSQFIWCYLYQTVYIWIMNSYNTVPDPLLEPIIFDHKEDYLRRTIDVKNKNIEELIKELK